MIRKLLPLGPLLLFVSTLSAQESDRDFLLKGIDVLPRNGVPGTVSVFGPKAFAILTGGGKQALPMTGASRFGKGRVVIAAHGYVGPANTPRDEQDPRSIFAHNVLEWLTVGKKKPKVGTLRSSPEEWKNFDVLLWLGAPDWPDNDWIENLQNYVHAGGSLFAGSCPWGWKQVTGRDLREDHPINRVVAPMGLALGDGYNDANQGGGFSVSKNRADRVHAGNVFAYYSAITTGKGERDNQPPFYPLIHAVDSLPKEDPILLPKLREFADRMPNPKAPTPDNPLSEKDGVHRLWVALQSRFWKDTPIESRTAFLGSDKFPGAVPSDAERNKRSLTLISSRPGWQSTGLYLPAGEILEVNRILGSAKDWSLRVGCHRDTLWHKPSWPRWPEITQELPLTEGMLVVSPWGGPVYFVAKPSAEKIKVSISGTVSAPLFVLGETTNKEWQQQRLAPGPWAELVGKECVLTVPSESVRELHDPSEVMEFWDGVITAHCKLGSEPIPLQKERFVADVLISAGYMHSGYPVMTHLDVAESRNGKMARVLDAKDLKKRGSWGHFHEWGHNRQKGWWTFSGTGEVTCNLFSLHAGEKLCGITPWENPWLEGQKKAAAKYLQSPDFSKWRASPGIGLVIYAMLQREFGWDAFENVFSQYHLIDKAKLPKNDQEKQDTFLRIFSLTVERDLRPMFSRWAWPMSPAILQDKSLGRLKEWGGDFRWAEEL
ncbi:MAG: M60 family metallopeptidase [Planctomycetota bacterium]|jgi:hypothetical protein|nr:M60 family metallopeptidase [Planctomycetota bacterium]MDP6941305.1 M60 family metallopeptidase [Planctomycetota bacterium]